MTQKQSSGASAGDPLLRQKTPLLEKPKLASVDSAPDLLNRQ